MSRNKSNDGMGDTLKIFLLFFVFFLICKSCS